MHKKKFRLKTVYYLAFSLLIVIPLFLVLLVALLVLNQQFKRQAIETIRRAQENVVTELCSDVDMLSMRLSHLIHTNNNEIVGYAAGTDTEDTEQRYEYEQKLSQAGNLALEPVKDVIAVGFYMKDGKETYIKNTINRTAEERKTEAWYQEALAHPNMVYVGAYDSTSPDDIYNGGKKDTLILVFALSPDVSTDRSQKIEMVAFYRQTGAGETIREYNREYQRGKNKLGMMQIVDEKENVVFSTGDDGAGAAADGRTTCVRTPLYLNNATWYMESQIKTSDLTKDFWRVAMMILAIAILIFIMAAYYSGYFLRSIIKPMEEISRGLRQVEEGNLEVHIAATGQSEVRSMIHQFNAMVRRLRALIEEYEERVKAVEKKPEDYFRAMAEGELSPSEVEQGSRDFFSEHYVIIGFAMERYPEGENEPALVKRLAEGFYRNPRFASRCLLYTESRSLFLALYRVREEDYIPRIVRMAEELQAASKREIGVEISVCIGREHMGSAEFLEGINEIREKLCLCFLAGEQAVLTLQRESREEEEQVEEILRLAGDYTKLAEALYVADEKNMLEERERLFGILEGAPRSEGERHVYAVILAIGKRFEADNSSLLDVFERKYNYVERLGRLEDIRDIRIWLTNYFAWIMDYAAAKLNSMELDVIIKAKRYMADNYENADLSLSQVAEYVGLNEKYFTNRFTKETGETFSSWLTGLRMQKAKELLKTTTFKVYEISEMVGYHNVEHFNRMFKKLNNISPAQYRKGT